MAKWHKKHISTKWGVAIIGFLLVSVILTVSVLNKTQSLQSSAKSLPLLRSYVYFDRVNYSVLVDKYVYLPINFRYNQQRKEEPITAIYLKLSYSPHELKFIDFIHPYIGSNYDSIETLKIINNINNGTIELIIKTKSLTKNQKIGAIKMAAIYPTEKNKPTAVKILEPISVLRVIGERKDIEGQGYFSPYFIPAAYENTKKNAYITIRKNRLSDLPL